LAQHYKTGLIINDNAYYLIPAKPSNPSGYQTLPESYSLKEYCPPPGNQTLLNTSVGWATSYAARTILTARNQEITDKSKIRDFAYSPIFPYYYAQEEGKHCHADADLGKALLTLKKLGTPKFIELMEFCPDEIDPSIVEIASKNAIHGYARLFNVFDSPETKINAVKKAISEGFPVVAGIQAPPSFWDPIEFWQPREEKDKKFPGHAICVIGYDNSKYGGSFEILNSWGKNWGNDGYIWIPYNYFAEYTRYGVELYDFSGKSGEKLSGNITFRLENYSNMPVSLSAKEGNYQVTQPYGMGTKFKIHVSSSESTFLYSFYTDLSFNITPIYPVDNISPVLAYGDSKVTIPPRGDFELDDTKGKDYLCFIFSKKEIDDRRLIKKLSQGKGSFAQRVRNELGSDLVDPGHISFDQNNLRFSADTQDGSMVVVIVEITHI